MISPRILALSALFVVIHLPMVSGTENKTQKQNSREETIVVLTLKEDNQDKIARLLNEGNFFMKKKYYRGALRKAQEVLKMDSANKEALSMKIQATQYLETAEERILKEADNYFERSEYSGAVKLYNRLANNNPKLGSSLESKIVKCYFNLGVRAQKNWKCDLAADYFRQVLYIDPSNSKSKEALVIAMKCDRSNLEMRKFVTLLKFRQ